MIWNSILNGLELFFTSWQIWLGILIYILIYLIGLSILVKNTISTFLLGPIFQGILGAIFITILLPIMFEDYTNIGNLFQNKTWWDITKLGIWSIVLTILLGILPLIGRLISDMPGTTMFMQGILIIGYFDIASPKFSLLIGICIVSGLIISVLTYLLMGLLSLFIKPDTYNEDFVQLYLGGVVMIIPGIISLCVYCSYIKLSFLSGLKPF
jgi:hypothetical protein